MCIRDRLYFLRELFGCVLSDHRFPRKIGHFGGTACAGLARTAVSSPGFAALRRERRGDGGICLCYPWNVGLGIRRGGRQGNIKRKQQLCNSCIPRAGEQ